MCKLSQFGFDPPQLVFWPVIELSLTFAKGSGHINSMKVSCIVIKKNDSKEIGANSVLSPPNGTPMLDCPAENWTRNTRCVLPPHRGHCHPHASVSSFLMPDMSCNGCAVGGGGMDNRNINGVWGKQGQNEMKWSMGS